MEAFKQRAGEIQTLKEEGEKKRKDKKGNLKRKRRKLDADEIIKFSKKKSKTKKK